MKVRDRVKICGSTIPKDFDKDVNPLDVVGTIVEMFSIITLAEPFNVKVVFDNGVANCYCEEHLLLQSEE